ncbi:glycine/D-amino acid oxidase-like deaminating enzyme [Rhizobium sp. BK376]|nr:glycine/D-amino acid oxidase-like deaminating enzyme [Rhizobium sp. BK376]
MTMTKQGLRIAVIGAGVVGAAIAWHLARRGASVHLFDEGPRPASGVTSRAFGWINFINGSPATRPEDYRLRRDGVEEYRRLATVLPDAVCDIRPGSLVWLETAEETEELIREHQAEGAGVELVDAVTIAKLEPHLRDVPPCAAYSPGDLALSPAALTDAFVKDAQAAGATAHFGETIIAIETSGSKVTGVRTTSGSQSADIVVLAAGVATGRLASALGADIGVESSPAVLLRYSASAPFINRILCGPGLEVRQWHDHSLFVAAAYRDDAEENSPAAVGQRALTKIRKRFAAPDDMHLVEAVVGQRPIFSDGLPRLGFLPDVEGAYVAVGHPGVILAPLMGRLAAEEIVDGIRQHSMLSPRQSEAG